MEFNELIASRMRELGTQFNEIHDAKLVGLLRTTIITLTDDVDVRKQLESATLTTINKIRQKDRIAAEFLYYCGLYDRACARAERAHLAAYNTTTPTTIVTTDHAPLLEQLVKAGTSNDRLLPVLDRWTDATKMAVLSDVFGETPEMDLDAQIVRLTREYIAAAEASLPVARLCIDDSV